LKVAITCNVSVSTCFTWIEIHDTSSVVVILNQVSFDEQGLSLTCTLVIRLSHWMPKKMLPGMLLGSWVDAYETGE
jgi:hypothetical protein